MKRATSITPIRVAGEGGGKRYLVILSWPAAAIGFGEYVEASGVWPKRSQPRAAGRGYCGLSRDDLIRSGAKLRRVADPFIERALEGELASREVIAGITEESEVMFLIELCHAEAPCGDGLAR